MKKHYGTCRICKKDRELTREHVPPKSAFNEKHYRKYYIDESKSELLQWQLEDVNERGIYVFSLCGECNTKTGGRYGSAYLEFVTSFCSDARLENANSAISARGSIYPARVVKQAVSMILSTSNPESFTGYDRMCNPLAGLHDRQHFAERFADTPDLSRLDSVYDELRNFVRLRDSKRLPPSVRLYAYAVANKGVGWMTGIFATGRMSRKSCFWGVVAGRWPVHWVLVLDGELDEALLDVTTWADFGFKDRVSQSVEMPCLWAASKYPFDFRSPEEIAKTKFSAIMKVSGFDCATYQNKEERFQAAVGFARQKGNWTREGYLISEFESGTYFEAEGRSGWLDGVKRDEAREIIKAQLTEIGNA